MNILKSTKENTAFLFSGPQILKKENIEDGVNITIKLF